MNEPMLDYVLEQLERSKGRLPAIAQAADIPYRSLQKIADGTVKNPGVTQIQKLHDYFQAQ